MSDRREGPDDRRLELTPSEDVFIATLDARLNPAMEKLERVEAALTGAKRRSGLALVGAVVSIALVLGVGFTVHQQNVDRHASRIAVCKNTNDGIEQGRLGAQALITVSQVARAQRAPETAAEAAERRRLTRIYLEAQHFRYDAVKDQAVAVPLDCDLFARDPAKARAKLEKERP